MRDPRQLRGELDRLAPDVWGEIDRRLEARKGSAALLAALERPPSARSRRYVELRLGGQIARAQEAA